MFEVDFFSKEFLVRNGIRVSSGVQPDKLAQLRVERVFNIRMDNKFLTFSVEFYMFGTHVGDEVFANGILNTDGI